MGIVYVIPNARDAVYVQALRSYVPLVPGTAHDSESPIVREHAWAFTADQPQPKRASGSAPVEQATAAPGEERKTRRQ